jgi:hypothetical protein
VAIWKNALRSGAYRRRAEKYLFSALCRLNANYKGAAAPGGYGSPLIDLANIDEVEKYDGQALWEFIDLRGGEQRGYYEELLTRHRVFDFPCDPSADFKYYTSNGWFVAGDAFTLAGVMQKERPARIIEIGSGFSSAVMLDVRRALELPLQLIFVEPHPGRLRQLADLQSETSIRLIDRKVQDVPMAEFEALEHGDILFIDSSHVAKIGSDLPWIFLRILPRLKPGVIVHFHDIFYPHSYPATWIHNGWAWNESLFLRTYLAGNPDFSIIAFNSFAACSFPDLFRARMPAFLDNAGGSLWLRRQRRREASRT